MKGLNRHMMRCLLEGFRLTQSPLHNICRVLGFACVAGAVFACLLADSEDWLAAVACFLICMILACLFGILDIVMTAEEEQETKEGEEAWN